MQIQMFAYFQPCFKQGQLMLQLGSSAENESLIRSHKAVFKY